MQITNRPTVGRDNDHTRDFKKRWETKIRGYSKELMEMLTEYCLEEVEMIEQEGKTIDNKIGELWDEQEKESFDKELTDMLKEDEENIRKLKEKKLKNDRIKTRTKETDGTNSPQYTAENVTGYIRDRMRSNKRSKRKQQQTKTSERMVRFATTNAECGNDHQRAQLGGRRMLQRDRSPKRTNNQTRVAHSESQGRQMLQEHSKIYQQTHSGRNTKTREENQQTHCRRNVETRQQSTRTLPKEQRQTGRKYFLRGARGSPERDKN